jgi:hypothetical protein
MRLIVPSITGSRGAFLVPHPLCSSVCRFQTKFLYGMTLAGLLGICGFSLIRLVKGLRNDEEVAR